MTLLPAEVKGRMMRHKLPGAAVSWHEREIRQTGG